MINHNMQVIRFLKDNLPEIMGGMLCLSLGLLSGYVSNSGVTDWYNSIIKPSFNPPSYVFGPVWSTLYIMIGVVLGKIIKHKSRRNILITVFLIQMCLNLSWSPLFFYFHRIDLALYNLILLWASIVLLSILCYRDFVIFILLIPYLAWVSFALLLNFNIFMLNF